MKKEVRKYKMSDSKLTQLAENIKNSAVRDLNELDEHGVSTDILNDLQSAIFNFKSKPTDEELSANIVIETQNRNSEKTVVMQQIKQISERARLKYGEFDDRFTKYGVDLQNNAESEKYTLTHRRVQRVPFEKLAELSTEGISQKMLDRLGCVNINIDKISDYQTDAVKIRDLVINDRIAAGNTLYAMMISLASKGKQCWLDHCESRYHDYIATENYINNWQCSDGNIGPFIVVNISVSSVSDATIFTLTNNSSVPLNFFFTQLTTDTSGSSQVTIAPGISQTYTAASLGYDESTFKTRLNVLNGNALPGSYLVEWL